MLTINTHEAKTRLSELLRDIEERGVRVQICRHGKPVAELGPLRTANPLKPAARLKARWKEDPALPLDPDDWPESP